MSSLSKVEKTYFEDLIKDIDAMLTFARSNGIAVPGNIAEEIVNLMGNGTFSGEGAPKSPNLKLNGKEDV